MRYRNPHHHTAVLPEHQEADGRVHPIRAVEPGEVLDWPIPIASFEAVSSERGTTAKKTTAVTVAGEAEAKGAGA